MGSRELVLKTPIVTALLIEGGAVQQIYRIWSEGSAAGQSLTGWIGVTIAVMLWLNFYKVITPEAKWAIRTTTLAVFLNATIVASIVYWRYFA